MPVAGKDGKTGQTMIKTVLAPAFRGRALRVEGWYSTNILGNRDGAGAQRPGLAGKTKLDTKGSVLDSILGYHVEDHVVAHPLLQAPRRRRRRPGTPSTSSASSASACR